MLAACTSPHTAHALTDKATLVHLSSSDSAEQLWNTDRICSTSVARSDGLANGSAVREEWS